MKIRLTSPPASETIVLESEAKRLGVISSMVLKDLDHAVFDHTEATIHCSIPILVRMVKYMKFIRLIRKRGHGIMGTLYVLNILACLDYASPKVVLTFIDNSLLYQTLCIIYSEAIFIFIQNGLRDVKTGWKMTMSNFYCFGEYEKESYQQYHHEVRQFNPVGALIGGYFKTEFAATGNNRAQYDLCLVSEWRPDIYHDTPDYKSIITGLNTINELVKRYIDENGKSLCIATSTPDPMEREYFEKYYKGKAQIIGYDSGRFTTYSAMDSSALVVTLHSTAAFEAFGWGQKVLFANLLGSPKADFPFPSICQIAGSDYESFAEKATGLLSMGQDEYVTVTDYYRRYYMNYDLDEPPHKVIRQFVMEQLQ